MSNLSENPWIAVSGPANHQTVYPIGVFEMLGTRSVDYIAVADDGNAHPWIVLHLAN